MKESCRILEQDWEGAWINRETFLLVKVTDCGNGTLHAVWIETSDNGDKLESHDIQLRQSGQMVFGNVKTKDGNVILTGVPPRNFDTINPDKEVYYTIGVILSCF